MLEVGRLEGESLQKRQFLLIVLGVIELQLVDQALCLLCVDHFRIVFPSHEDNIQLLAEFGVVDQAQALRSVFFMNLNEKSRLSCGAHFRAERELTW